MNYEILILPIVAGLIAQISKFFIENNQQKFSYKNIFAYSGMPSGHSAIVVSLATIIGLLEGMKSSLFAVSIILAIIVIRDAIGIRRYLGQHGRTLNVLVKDLRDDNVLEENYPRLLEKIGHTPIQVLIGSMIGFITSIIGYFIF